MTDKIPLARNEIKNYDILVTRPILVKNIYDEVVAESIKNLADNGIYVSESELDCDSLERETYKRFEALCH